MLGGLHEIHSPKRSKLSEKYDYFLGDDLLNAEYSARNLDIEATKKLLLALISKS